MTVRHRYATWSKFVVSSVVALAVIVGLGLPGTHAEPVQIAFEVLDGPGVGFNDPLLGPQRLQAFAFAAARWGSFFVSAFPGETVPVGIRFGPLTDFLAFSNTFHLDTGDVSLPGALAEHIFGGDVLPGLDGEIIFSAQAPFFLGTTGQPASTQYDFVTFAMHELGHLFGFTSFLQPDGTYQGSPTLYDLFVGDAAGTQLMTLPPAARLAAATSGDGLIWLGPQGVAGNDGVPPQLSAGTPFVLATNVNHLSETFGPDVLMDPDKAFGEVIHGLSPLERGMYEDLFWTLTPVQAVPEPASLWLVGAGLVGLLGYGWRQRLLGRPASESGSLRHGDGDPEGGDRRRRGLVLATLHEPHVGQATRSTARSFGPPETKMVGRFRRRAAMSIPGVILSQLEMHTRASAQWALTMYSTGIGDQLARGQAVQHALVPHGDAVVHGDGVELLGHCPGPMDLFRH